LSTEKNRNFVAVINRRPLADGDVTFFVSESSESCQVQLDEHVTTVAPNRAGAVIVMHDGARMLFGGVR
jgi:hypothetical protein